MKNKSNKDFFVGEMGVAKCKTDLAKYFHPPNSELTKRFSIIYRIFGLNDDSIARKIGIDRTTMNRYRRGIFIPTTGMKILIAQKMSELANYQIDSAVLWGDSLIFEAWKRRKEEKQEKREDE